jgi:ketosteroid isomerase-like protein
MSQENVEMVRRAFQAYDRGDIDRALADFAPDCEYFATGAIPGRSGVFRGPEGYKEFFGWLRGEFDEARVDIDELIDAGESVVVAATIRGRGKQSGAPASWNIWQVWTVQNGKFVRGRGFTNRAEALEAAGLSE